MLIFVCFLRSHYLTGFFIIVLEAGGQGSSNFFSFHIVMAVCLHSFSRFRRAEGWVGERALDMVIKN